MGELMVARELEVELMFNDKRIRETAEVRNAVESYVYDVRSKLREGEALAEYIEDDARVAFISLLNDTEDWLYDEGEDCAKKVYDAKLAELKAVGDKPQMRKDEETRRPAALATLTTALSLYGAFVQSTEEKYAHIKDEDRAKATKIVTETQSWLENTLASLADLPKTADPPV